MSQFEEAMSEQRLTKYGLGVTNIGEGQRKV